MFKLTGKTIFNNCNKIFDLGAKTQSLVKLYIKLTNHLLHMTSVAKCHNLHALSFFILLHCIKDSISNHHYVTVFPVLQC